LGCNGMVGSRGRSPRRFPLCHAAFASASTVAAVATGDAAAGASSPSLAVVDPCHVVEDVPAAGHESRR
jgi:hypothetical protein